MGYNEAAVRSHRYQAVHDLMRLWNGSTEIAESNSGDAKRVPGVGENLRVNRQEWRFHSRLGRARGIVATREVAMRWVNVISWPRSVYNKRQ